MTHDDSYSREILASCGGAKNFDGIEIHGVRDLPPKDNVVVPEMDDEHPEYFSVYLHYGPGQDRGGLECVGDFLRHETALTYAQLLSKQYHWPVQDFIK